MIQLQVSIHSYLTFKNAVLKTPNKKTNRTNDDSSSLSSISDYSSNAKRMKTVAN
jgi:hypothetical protein